MLVDLDWLRPTAGTRDADPRFLSGFDADERGGLRITLTYGEKRFTRRVATRLARGIYLASDLEHAIRDFTAFDATTLFEEGVALFRRLAESPRDGAEGSLLRQRMRHEHMRTDYGVADTLRQVYDHGRSRVRSPRLFALGVCPLTRGRDGWLTDGPYIGPHREVRGGPGGEPPLRFCWYVLTPKAEVPRADRV